jgi:hypothetical protein
MDAAERVHVLFRGAAEVTKSLRRGALCCDSLTTGISLYTVLAKPADSSAWLPLGILVIALVGMALRAYSSVANGFAQRCRRISIKAFCMGREVSPVIVSFLDDEAPPFVEMATSHLRAKSMLEYYDPTTPVGPLRMAELYAHSAFFTWRLLRMQAWITVTVAAALTVACAFVTYHLAAVSGTTSDRRGILEAISTIVLLTVAAKGFEASWAAYTSCREIRSIENEILKTPQGEGLEDLVDSYDIERAAGPSTSGVLYHWRCRTLAAKWNDRRTSFINATAASSKPTEGEA